MKGSDTKTTTSTRHRWRVTQETMFAIFEACSRCGCERETSKAGQPRAYHVHGRMRNGSRLWSHTRPECKPKTAPQQRSA